MSQQQFDQQVAQINEKLDGIGRSVASEAQQIRDFIAANPSVDTSALSSVVDRLDAVDVSVSEIFTPPAAEPVIDEGNGDPEPAAEPTNEPGNDPAETTGGEDAGADPAETTAGEGDGDGGDPQESTATGGEGEGSATAGGESSDSSGPIEG